jgi:hypothetical protein
MELMTSMLITSVLVFCLFTQALNAAEVSELFAKAKNSVVVIVSQDANQAPLAIGSGFFFRKRLIATNYHVVQDASSFKIKVVGDNTKITTARVKSYSEALDLAILETQEDGIALPLATTNAVEMGQKVVAIGNPRGLTGTVSDGIVSGIRDLDSIRVYQITAPISPGSSGGPVLLPNGEVLGIATFTLTDSQNLNFAMPCTLLGQLEQKSMKWEPATNVSPLYKKGNDGVRLVLFRKEKEDFLESFNVNNTTKNAITNITVLLLYKMPKGAVFDFRMTTIPELIPPGLAKMVTQPSFDQSQHFEYCPSCRGDADYFDVELRVLSYEIVEQGSSIADKLLDNETKDLP